RPAVRSECETHLGLVDATVPDDVHDPAIGLFEGRGVAAVAGPAAVHLLEGRQHQAAPATLVEVEEKMVNPMVDLAVPGSAGDRGGRGWNAQVGERGRLSAPHLIEHL